MTARPTPWALLALAPVLACTAIERVDIELPPLEGARAALLVVRGDDGVRAWALDPAGRAALPALTDEGPLELAVVGFTYPLDKLGLTARELDLSTLTTGRALRPSIAWEASVEATPSPWTRTVQLPAALAAVRLPAASGPCIDHRVRSHGIPSPGRAGVLIALDAERALVGTREHDFFLSTRDDLTPLPALTGLPGTVGARARDGELWLFGRDGKSAHGTLEHGFTAGPIVPGEPELVAVSAVPGSTRALDLMVVAATGTLYHFDGVRWVTLAEPRGTGGLGRGVAAVGPGHAVFTAYDVGVYRYRDRRLSEEHAYPDRAREIVSSALIPGLGVVVGAAIEGRCLVDRGDVAWRFIEPQDDGPSGLGIDVNELQPYRGGFWAGGSTGAHTQWYPDWGFCSPGPPLSSKSVTRAVVLGDSLVITTDYAIGLNPTVAWLDPR